MGMFDFLFGSNEAQQTTSQIKLPGYIDKATESLVATAGDVAKEGFIPYTGQRLAGLTTTEADAIATAKANQGIGSTRAGLAFDAATDAGGGVSSADINAYMNPYMTNVADIAARELTDRSKIEGQNISAQAANVGAFGGSRQAILEAERQKNLQQGIGDIYTQAQAQAYDKGLSAAQIDNKQGLASAIGMGQLATTGSTLDESQLRQQLGLGGLERNMNQQALDLGYQTFLQERDYPKSQLGFYSNTLRGVPYSKETVSSTTTPQPSMFSQLAGAGIGGLSAAGSLGLSWSDLVG
mgnify:FL=1|tara:strand:- start:175 stop:1062 length:888 start_codon:yes stop_codon:yes gene_type:complete